jgi:pyridoxal phosphate enzyme (YggS family)
MAVDPAQVARNITEVRGRIERAGGAGRVTLVAVTKGFGADAARAALAAGVEDLGESYLQEMQQKIEDLSGDEPRPRWHAIGRLQRNKVRLVAPHVHLWHSVDRRELGAEIARRQPGASVLAQVNVSGETQKGGCDPDATATLVGDLRDLGLDVRGLMTIGRLGDGDAARPGFRLLATLARQLGLTELSMGMSDDLEVAVEEGATMVRIGRSLFGERPQPTAPATRPTGRSRPLDSQG